MALPPDDWSLRMPGGDPASTVSCGFMTKRAGTEPRGSRRPGFAAVLCLRGEGELQDATGTHRVAPGTVFCRFADRPHSLRVSSSSWHEAWISFGAPAEAMLVALRVLDHARPVVPVEPTQAWLRELAACIAPLREAPDADVPRLAARLFALLVELLRPPRQGGLDLDRACRLLADPRSDLRGIARACGLGYDAFRREFRRRAGLSPGAYRQRRRLEAACVALEATGQPIHRIAADLGYANPFAFSAAFRRATGRAPREWRRGSGGTTN